MLEELINPIRISLQVAIIASIIVITFGTLIAKGMAHRNFRGKLLVETLFLMPLVLPPSVIGFVLLVVFGVNSPIGEAIEWIFDQPVVFTIWAAIIASTVVSFPLMYQSAKNGFESVDSDIEDAARVDGANGKQVFYHISMPLAKTYLLSGSILSFARALGEFGATLMVAGNIPGKTQTVPTAIYLAIETGNMGLAWLWAGIMVLISFLMLVLVSTIKPTN
ncbi:molybdate ABC transporter permease subunit [Bacillus suaedaesalsae]|uniref:Molybdenum transport system permease n=1 Tax=Bacillus suaedaesalsae TaxID=2810349 RepID=A0ABS2DH03_9BACI|nr:molybdate ABC transporter permease subunit [Bacillus suaedaesalsae]MBM6617740.1 molybdate ABC transporter permease subunit [Bacillus suaedaesalsae]